MISEKMSVSKDCWTITGYLDKGMLCPYVSVCVCAENKPQNMSSVCAICYAIMLEEFERKHHRVPGPVHTVQV